MSKLHGVLILLVVLCCGCTLHTQHTKVQEDPTIDPIAMKRLQLLLMAPTNASETNSALQWVELKEKENENENTTH